MVPASVNVMTLVASPLQLSSEANAIVAAINGTLATRLDGLQVQMGMLAGQMTSLKTDVVQMSAQKRNSTTKRMSEFERQLKDITAGRSCGSGAASSAASSELHPEPARETQACILQKNQRTALVVGDVNCEKLGEIFGHELGVKDWWTPGKVGSMGNVSFHTNDHVWTFLR